MIDDLWLGVIAAGLPLLVVGAIALRRMPAILAFYLALVVVGLGYLTTTGTMTDIGAKVRPHVPAKLLGMVTPAPTPTPVPADSPVTPAPTAAPAAPAPAATPAPTPAPAPATP